VVASKTTISFSYLPLSLICVIKKINIALYEVEPVHPAYNPSFSACFFSRNHIFLSQQISQQCFSAGLPAQPNGAVIYETVYVYQSTCPECALDQTITGSIQGVHTLF
jgi:hypothetical protein